MKYCFLLVFMVLLNFSLHAQTCPDVGTARKKVASSFHTTIMIDHTGAVKYWGENSSSGGNTSITSPQTLSSQAYSGTPLAVAATSYYVSNWSHMHYLLTSDSLYGWGAIDGPGGGYRSIATIDLPATLNGTANPLTAADIEFITASGGGLAIVTKINSRTNGEVYVRNPSNTGGSTVYGYGDGTTTGAMNNLWHQVKLNGTTYLHSITRLSYSQKALMALNQSNQIYVWGEQVWTDNAIVANQPFASPVLNMPAGVTAADINIISRVSYDAATVQYATQFILGTNGLLYGIGEGYRGILGQGNDNDASTWIQVKSLDGNGVLDNIVQISSNNTHVYYLSSSNQNYYSIGALNSDGQLFMWGDNSKSMIGGTANSYSLPTIPPNFNINDARVGYFCMGGHTTLAFLKGTNRFCYIGHRINGSMGDGTSTDNTNPSYDCINTPNAYICPPPAPLGCATASANDLLASSVNATIVINGQPAASYWGESSSSAEAGQNVPLPRTLYEYNGTPKGVAASGVSTSGTAGTQMWILSDAGIWGWGYSANTINTAAATTGLTKIALPAGVAIGEVSFIRSAKGGLALVTNTGHVWIKAGVGSACTAAVYGDGSSVLDGNWHEVTVSPSSALSDIIELSFGGSAAVAISANGNVYVWGTNIYDGISAPTLRNRAFVMTLHADFTGPVPVMPRKAEIIQTGTNGAAQFILGSNGKVYSVGGNLNGVLGIGTTTDQTTWSVLAISNIQRLSSNNSFPDGYYSIGALTATGTLYLWGSNSNGMLGGGATSSFSMPTIPALSALGTGITATDNVNGFEVGGRQTIIFTKPIAANPDNKFLFAGLNSGGAKGDASPAPAATVYNTFTFGAGVINCAGAVYNLSGHVYHDPNGTKDAGGGIVYGSSITSVSGAPTLYVNLLDESGMVVNTTPLAPDGSYSFTNLPAASYTIQVATAVGGLFNPAPAANLPLNWAFAGEQAGTVAGTGLNTGVNTGTGRMSIILADNTSNMNFGLEQRPVADPKSFVIANNQFSSVNNPPANFPARANYKSIPVSHAAFTGYNTSAQGSLSGSDVEDCTMAGSCNTGNSSSFKISTIASNTELWYYNGTAAIQLTAGQVINNFNAANLVVYGLIGSGNNANPLGFTYQLIDAAGAESVPASYSISTGSTALPVMLKTFGAAMGTDCTAIISWTTGTEDGVASYEVQQSTDAQGFITVGTIKPTGSGSAYTYHTAISVKGLNYYRLLSHDLNGAYYFSNVARINASCNSRSPLGISPNPVTDMLQIGGVEMGDQLAVYNSIGQIVIAVQSSEAGRSIINLNNLAAGIYILHIKDKNGAAVSLTRFVKQ